MATPWSPAPKRSAAPKLPAGQDYDSKGRVVTWRAPKKSAPKPAPKATRKAAPKETSRPTRQQAPVGLLSGVEAKKSYDKPINVRVPIYDSKGRVSGHRTVTQKVAKPGSWVYPGREAATVEAYKDAPYRVIYDQKGRISRVAEQVASPKIIDTSKLPTKSKKDNPYRWMVPTQYLSSSAETRDQFKTTYDNKGRAIHDVSNLPLKDKGRTATHIYLDPHTSAADFAKLGLRPAEVNGKPVLVDKDGFVVPGAQYVERKPAEFWKREDFYKYALPVIAAPIGAGLTQGFGAPAAGALPSEIMAGGSLVPNPALAGGSAAGAFPVGASPFGAIPPGTDPYAAAYGAGAPGSAPTGLLRGDAATAERLRAAGLDPSHAGITGSGGAGTDAAIGQVGAQAGLTEAGLPTAGLSAAEQRLVDAGLDPFGEGTTGFGNAETDAAIGHEGMQESLFEADLGYVGDPAQDPVDLIDEAGNPEADMFGDATGATGEAVGHEGIEAALKEVGLAGYGDKAGLLDRLADAVGLTPEDLIDIAKKLGIALGIGAVASALGGDEESGGGGGGGGAGTEQERYQRRVSAPSDGGDRNISNFDARRLYHLWFKKSQGTITEAELKELERLVRESRAYFGWNPVAAGAAASEPADSSEPTESRRQGGWIRPDSDMEMEPRPIEAHENEYVIRPEAVEEIGIPALDELNRLGRNPEEATQSSGYTSEMQDRDPRMPGNAMRPHRSGNMLEMFQNEPDRGSGIPALDQLRTLTGPKPNGLMYRYDRKKGRVDRMGAM